MGTSSSKSIAVEPSASVCPVKHEEESQPSGCPVKHNNIPLLAKGCPMKKKKEPMEYNVYSEPIDPTNQMPTVANQLPSALQSESLSTERKCSTIPKGNAESGTTWTYPSPQMFYNALARKGKLGETKENEIESVVALHNNMNERTWSKVMEWEELITGEKPKLLKFLGRPSDLSPKAYLKHYLFGYPLPFDRHDWTIQRSEGNCVRYVIDYYHDDTKGLENAASALPDMHDFAATPSLLVDVRPALDSPALLYDRAVRMPMAQVSGSTKFENLPLLPSTSMKTQVSESLKVWDSIQKAAKERKDEVVVPITEKEAMVLTQTFGKALGDCHNAKVVMDQCDSDEACAKASMSLTVCIGKTLCPLQHQSMIKALNVDNVSKGYEDRVEAALENLQTCVAASNTKMAQAKQLHPKLFS